MQVRSSSDSVRPPGVIVARACSRGSTYRPRASSLGPHTRNSPASVNSSQTGNCKRIGSQNVVGSPYRKYNSRASRRTARRQFRGVLWCAASSRVSVSLCIQLRARAKTRNNRENNVVAVKDGLFSRLCGNSSSRSSSRSSGAHPWRANVLAK